MELSDRDVAFLQDHHSAAMITTARSGVAKAVRVGVALVDGKLWSSGTQDRVRTKRLRSDPRCTLFVFDSGFAWLALETTVTLLEGDDAPALNLRLFRTMQGKREGPLTWYGEDLTEDGFVQRMVDERRLVYQFEVQQFYGMY
jgi:hypothetical protein